MPILGYFQYNLLPVVVSCNETCRRIATLLLLGRKLDKP